MNQVWFCLQNSIFLCWLKTRQTVVNTEVSFQTKLFGWHFRNVFGRFDKCNEFFLTQDHVLKNLYLGSIFLRSEESSLLSGSHELGGSLRNNSILSRSRHWRSSGKRFIVQIIYWANVIDIIPSLIQCSDHSGCKFGFTWFCSHLAKVNNLPPACKLLAWVTFTIVACRTNHFFVSTFCFSEQIINWQKNHSGRFSHEKKGFFPVYLGL